MTYDEYKKEVTQDFIEHLVLAMAESAYMDYMIQQNRVESLSSPMAVRDRRDAVREFERIIREG